MNSQARVQMGGVHHVRQPANGHSSPSHDQSDNHHSSYRSRVPKERAMVGSPMGRRRVEVVRKRPVQPAHHGHGRATRERCWGRGVDAPGGRVLFRAPAVCGPP